MLIFDIKIRNIRIGREVERNVFVKCYADME